MPRDNTHSPGLVEKETFEVQLDAAEMPSLRSMSSPPKASVSASVLSADLSIIGTLKTTGAIQLEGFMEGDIDASLITIGANASLRGQLKADDIMIKGHIMGSVQALKVRLTSTARVQGDIIHRVLAVESGADFDGLVQRMENKLKFQVPGIGGTLVESSLTKRHSTSERTSVYKSNPQE